MKRYAGILEIVEKTGDEGSLVRLDFSYAVLRDGRRPRPFEDIGPSPWHPALAAMLASIGIDPRSVQEACRDQIATHEFRFTVARDEHGHPVEDENGLRLPERHPAISGDNSPANFDDPRTLCTVMFWDIGQANVIMLPPDGHVLFEFADPTDEAPVHCTLPALPQTHVMRIAERVEIEQAVRFSEISDAVHPAVADLRITRIGRVGDSTAIEME